MPRRHDVTLEEVDRLLDDLMDWERSYNTSTARSPVFRDSTWGRLKGLRVHLRAQLEGAPKNPQNNAILHPNGQVTLWSANRRRYVTTHEPAANDLKHLLHSTREQVEAHIKNIPF